MRKLVSLAILATITIVLCSCDTQSPLVKVRVVPGEADIIVDGHLIGSTSGQCTFVRLSPGIHTIKAEASGFSAREVKIQVLKKGDTLTPGDNQEGFDQYLCIEMKKSDE